MLKDTLWNKIQGIIYYLIIVVVSLLATCFLPFIGSKVNVDYTPPQSQGEWIIFWTTRAIISVLNVIIFYCFTKQAEVNVKEDENYKKACEIVRRIREKKPRNPRSPIKFKAIQWSTKATTLALSSVLATFTLTGIVLQFDIVQLLVFGFVIMLGIVFGIFTMKNNEYYWTHEFLEYAIMLEKNEEDKNGIHNR